MPTNPATVSSGQRIAVGFSLNGQLMNQGGPALRSLERDGTYEHLASGELDEGYALFYRSPSGDHVAYDVFVPTLGIVAHPPQLVRDDSSELVQLSESATVDGRILIRQTFTWSTNATRVDIRMQLTNTSSEDLLDVVVKRYADLDVDTGGTRGWANYQNHWAINRDSVMAFNNPSEAPIGHCAHIVNMVAMPGDLAFVEAFAGLFGTNQYSQRANTDPVPSAKVRVDGVGVLQWQTPHFRSGETIRLHLYYDVYCLCSDIRMSELDSGGGGSGGGSGGGGSFKPSPWGAKPVPTPLPPGGGTAPVASGAGAPAPGAPPTPAGYAADNDLEYLIDGVTVYKRTSDLLKAVATGAGGQGWVHMRFWECTPETTLEAGITFRDRIAQVAASGNEVRIILWKPSILATNGGFDYGVGAENARCKAVLEAIDPVHIKVELVEHPDITGALHTKTMIFGLGDSVSVIVGGLNMNNAYYDAAPHNTSAQTHDVAVEYRGPATVDVEKDFAAKWPASAGAVKGPLVPQPAGTMDIYATRTNTPATRSFHDELLQRVREAESFAYIENYAIHDPELINLLSSRIDAGRLTGHPFTVILLVCDTVDDKYSWLHYVTYCALSIASSSSVTYNDGSGPKTVTRAINGQTAWIMDTPWSGDWYENSEFEWDTGHTNIKNITNFVNDTPIYKLVYCTSASPAKFGYIMVHSKVSIFDDKFAGIGSGNFNPRSMNQDDELTSFITSKDATPVLALRNALWGEHFPGGGGAFPTANWQTLAAANKALAAAGSVTVGRQYVLPIDISEYRKAPPVGFPISFFKTAAKW